MDDGVSYRGTTAVSPTVATTAAEVPPHHARQVLGLLFDLLSRSRLPMPSVRHRHHAAVAGAFRDTWSQQMEPQGDADADGAVVGEEEEDDDDDDPYGGWLLGAVPASGDAMAALPETTVAEAEVEGAAREEGECCAVCLEEYAVGDALRTLPCKHGFHGGCILGWLRVSRLCPLCRFALPAAEAGTDSDSEENWWGGDNEEEHEDQGTLELLLSVFVTESIDEAGTGTP